MRRPQEHPHHKLRWHVDAAVLKLHSRRCTCLEFHPHKDHLVLSGDKKGQVGALAPSMHVGHKLAQITQEWAGLVQHDAGLPTHLLAFAACSMDSC